MGKVVFMPVIILFVIWVVGIIVYLANLHQKHTNDTDSKYDVEWGYTSNSPSPDLTRQLSLSEQKGIIGESILCNILNNQPGYKRVLQNVYLPVQEGYTEIDVLMINTQGIHVFEVKNYSGWIFGTDTSPNWTETTLVGNTCKKYSFYNPVFQNDLHVRKLKALLCSYKLPFYVNVYSYVCFTSANTLKNITRNRQDYSLGYIYDMPECIKQNNSSKNELTNDQIDLLYSKLVTMCNRSSAFKEAHAERVRHKYN